MSNTNKPTSGLDGNQTLSESFNAINSTLSVDGFLTGLVGRRVTLVISTTNSANDTETYTFSESGINLYSIQIVYTDGTRSTMSTATRIS